VRWSPLPWLLNAGWGLLLLVITPIIVYRMIAVGKHRGGWSQKLLGLVPALPAPRPGQTRYWFHAVSVGEVLLLPAVIERLRTRQPDAEIIVTTTTDTGYAVARDRVSTTVPGMTLAWFPLDFSWAVRRAMRRLKPTRIVLAELELWPNFLLSARRAGIPVSLINGRLSERSFRGYHRIRRLMAPLVRSLDQIAVQNEVYAERFRRLGADADRVHVTGSVKFDRVETRRDTPRTVSLREAFGLNPEEPVLIAGSTQAPEERIAIESWLKARQTCPALRLILVPRHRERFEEVARLVQSLRLPLLRRSDTTPEMAGEAGSSRRQAASGDSSPILLLDTLGELAGCWGLADFAFVGGSLGNRGGQNMIEPAGYGAAVCFGPNTRNFRDVVDALLAHEAATVVRDGDDLTATLRNWLENRDAATAQGRRAQAFVQTQQGASQRTVELLLTADFPNDAARKAAA